MKASLDNFIIVYVTKADYDECITTGEPAWYYLTLQDLYEEAGIVPHQELIMPEWLKLEDLKDNFIDLSVFSLN